MRFLYFFGCPHDIIVAPFDFVYASIAPSAYQFNKLVLQHEVTLPNFDEVIPLYCHLLYRFTSHLLYLYLFDFFWLGLFVVCKENGWYFDELWMEGGFLVSVTSIDCERFVLGWFWWSSLWSFFNIPHRK